MTEKRRPWDYGDGCVVINDLVQLSSNNGIVLWDWTNFTYIAEIPRWPAIAAIIAEYHSIDVTHLTEAIEKAKAYSGHALLAEGLCLGWPTGDKGPITFERFLEIIKHEELRWLNNAAKRHHTKIRRREFQASRSQIILRMIEAGIPHVCAHPGCNAATDLTIDHREPLSRGGADDISNLQFMCLSHNSKKGDKAA
jgi:HNH endonuclease